MSCNTPTLEQTHASCLNNFFTTQHHKLGEHCIGEERALHVLSPIFPEGKNSPHPHLLLELKQKLKKRD